MHASRALARTAGGLYLLLIALGVFAELVVRGGVRAATGPASGIDAIATHAGALRAGLTADIAMATVFVLLALALQRLLGDVDRRAAATMVTFASVGAGMILSNLLLHHAALLVATASTPQAGPAAAFAPLLLQLHGAGYALAGIFFGLWLLPLGGLVRRSGWFPRGLGALLMASCALYVADTLLTFAVPGLHPGVHDAITAPTALAEFGLTAYLLIVGVRAPRHNVAAAPTG